MKTRKPPAPTIRDGLARDHVMVTLVDSNGAGLSGICWAVDDTGVLLRSGAGAPLTHVDASGEQSDPLDGSEFIPMHRVDFIQIIRGGPT